MIPRRPQRTLTEQELDRIRDTPALILHKSLILGLVDPVPRPSPMPEHEGTWVREHVWPTWIRTIDDPYPWGFWRWSSCERGSCWNCINHACGTTPCVHRQQGPHIDREPDHLYNQHGQRRATVLRPEDNPVCVWLCRCPCSKEGTVVTPAQENSQVKPPKPRPARLRPSTAQHDDGALFALEDLIS